MSTAELAPTGRRLAQVDGIRAVVAPPRWTSDGQGVLAAFPQEQSYTAAGRELFSRVKNAVEAPVGGPPAQSADFIGAVYGAFPTMIALVAILTCILLARAFRSLLLPAKAVVLNLLLFGIDATGAVVELIPLMVFAFLCGLSMDYEVFILSRIREEDDRTGSTARAAIEGIARTGRLVTSAALILFLSFAAIGSGPEVFLEVFATGLAAGILLDAVVVRSLLLPALVALYGRWDWWLPAPVAHVLRVAPSAARGG